MGRPKLGADVKKTRVLGAKLTAPEEIAWDALRAKLGGVVPARDTDALRFLIADGCRRYGINWPGEDGPPAPTWYQPPGEAAEKPVQEPTVEFDPGVKGKKGVKR